jgi:hypothetical protein
MTHEELMEAIKDKFNFHTGKHDAEIVNALYKVVELHKPTPLDERGDVCLTCCPDLLTLYPCSTIQIIEKELK